MRYRVLVTGAASGMGAATSRLLTESGHIVTALDRDEAGLHRLHDEGGAASILVCDLGDGDAIEHALAGVTVDRIANVAGVGPDTEDPRLVFAVNLLAPLKVIELLGPTLPHGGAIVNVASIAGELADDALDLILDDPYAPTFVAAAANAAGSGAAAYAYSKRGLIEQSRRLAVELGSREVRCNTVLPGLIATPMGERSMRFGWVQKLATRIPLGRSGSATEVAAVVAFLLSDAATYVTGASIPVDGGYVTSWRARQIGRKRESDPQAEVVR